MSDRISLSRDQIQNLHEIITKFPEVSEFVLTTSHASGIGPAVSVGFTWLDTNQKIDITDYRSW